MKKITNENELQAVQTRIDEIVAAGDKVGGVSLLAAELQQEYNQLSDMLYDYETEAYDCSWRVKKSVIEAIKKSFKAKGMKQKEAAEAIGMSTTGFSDLLNGRRPLSFETARHLYNILGVPADVIFA